MDMTEPVYFERLSSIFQYLEHFHLKQFFYFHYFQLLESFIAGIFPLLIKHGDIGDVYDKCMYC